MGRPAPKPLGHRASRRLSSKVKKTTKRSRVLRSFADWELGEKCSELKSTASWCPWQSQRSHGSAGSTFQELSEFQDGVSDDKTTKSGHGGAGMGASVLLENSLIKDKIKNRLQAIQCKVKGLKIVF